MKLQKNNCQEGGQGMASHKYPSQVQTAEVPLDWARQWYPVGFVADVEPGRPHQVTVLGLDLVLWRDSQGDWRAFKDRCPHRLAPLSGD